MARSPGFRTTRWSLVLRARADEQPVARKAIGELCALYWYPLYAYLRRRGEPADNAHDLVQGLCAQLLEGGALTATPARGRFRDYVLGALRHHADNQLRARRTQRRGGGAVVLSLDADAADARYAREPAMALTPEHLFARRWAMTVLETAMAALAEEQRLAGKETLFAALRPALAGAEDSPAHAAIAARLHTSPGAVKVALHRLRTRLRDRIRAEVAHTVDDPAEVAAEVAALFAALAVRPAGDERPAQL